MRSPDLRPSLPRTGIRTAALGLLALSALAGAGRAGAESYFAITFGGSKTENSSLRIRDLRSGTDATFHNVKWKADNFESPPYYGWKLGGYSEKSPHWGAEMDYVHYKVYAQVDRTVPVSGTWNGVPISGNQRLGNYVQRFDISHGVNTFTLSLLYRWTGKATPTFPHGRLQPYVGLGPTYYVLHPENRVGGVTNNQRYKPAGVGWQGQAGVRYGLSRKLTLFAEGKYSVGQGEVDTNGGGFANTSLRTFQAAGGVQYGF